MTLFLLSEVLAKRGITHKESKVDRNFVQVYELIDGRSLPVITINLIDGTFLEMPHYSRMTEASKLRLADAHEEYHHRFMSWNEKKPLTAGKQGQ